MQLKEILELLKVTPMNYNVIMIAAFILTVISFVCMLAYSEKYEEFKFAFSHNIHSFIVYSRRTIDLY